MKRNSTFHGYFYNQYIYIFEIFNVYRGRKLNIEDRAYRHCGHNATLYGDCQFCTLILSSD